MVAGQKEVINVSLPVVSDEEIVNWQYDRSPDPHNNGNPDSTIVSSLIFRPGAFRHRLSTSSSVAYIDASQTAIIFVDDGFGESSTYPVATAAEQGNLPIESTNTLSAHASIAAINAETPPTAAQFKIIWKSAHTHRATPTKGSFSTLETRRNFAKSQVGLVTEPHRVRHRPLSTFEVIGDDGVPF